MPGFMFKGLVNNNGCLDLFQWIIVSVLCCHLYVIHYLFCHTLVKCKCFNTICLYVLRKIVCFSLEFDCMLYIEFEPNIGRLMTDGVRNKGNIRTSWKSAGYSCVYYVASHKIGYHISYWGISVEFKGSDSDFWSHETEVVLKQCDNIRKVHKAYNMHFLKKKKIKQRIHVQSNVIIKH